MAADLYCGVGKHNGAWIECGCYQCGGHFRSNKGERAPLIGAETDPMDAMDHNNGNGESEPEVSGSEYEGAAAEQ